MSFPDKVIGIIGQNGAGKSSIIEAIAWALYGNQVARSGKEEIKSVFAGESADCSVSLTFQINDEIYRIDRKLIGKSNRAEVQLFRDKGSESVGVAETKGYIEQLLGLDWRGFLSSFLARQSELNALSDLQPSKRRDHIAGMLGITRLDKVISRIKSEAKLNKERVDFFETKILAKDELSQNLKQFQKEESELKSRIESLKPELELIKKDFSIAQNDLKESEKERSKVVSLEAEIKGLNGSLQLIEEQISQLEKKLKELSELKQEIPILEKSVIDIPDLKNIEKSLSKARIVENEQKELLKNLSDYKKELEELIQSKVKIENELKLNDQELAEIPEDISKQIEKMSKQLEDFRNSYSELKAELKTVERELESLNNQLATIQELGPDSVCDKCLRPMGDSVGEIKAHLDKEEKSLIRKIDDLKNQLLEAESKGKSLKTDLSKKEELSKQRDKIINQNSQYSNDHKNINNNIEKLAQNISKTEARLKEIGSVSFDSAEYNKVIKKLEELQAIESKLNRIKVQVASIEEINSSFENNRQKQKDILSQIEKLNSEKTDLAYSSEIHEKLTTEFNRKQAELENKNDQYNEIVNQEKIIKVQIKNIEERLAEISEIEKELEKEKTDHFYNEKLSNLFMAFRKELISSIRPTLAEISSRLFNEMTGNKYSFVELDKEYNLRVMDQGQFYGIERFSGGEKDLANLCLRLAISLGLTESAGLTSSFIILDEVFGSQDINRKNNILKALAKLKNRFPQILLITHVDDIKDGVEQTINVVANDNGFSEVIVDEDAA